jgi:hypothetical protein
MHHHVAACRKHGVCAQHCMLQIATAAISLSVLSAVRRICIVCAQHCLQETRMCRALHHDVLCFYCCLLETCRLCWQHCILSVAALFAETPCLCIALHVVCASTACSKHCVRAEHRTMMSSVVTTACREHAVYVKQFVFLILTTTCRKHIVCAQQCLVPPSLQCTKPHDCTA